jgi:CRP/FNR family transcriptional regulator, anaerobic regulatory protein
MITSIDKKVASLYPSFEQGLLDEIQQAGSTKHFAPGDELMRPGQYIRSMMLILDGLIKVYREDGEGNEFFMYYLKPGEACALSMVCASKQEASQVMAKAVKDTDVLMVPIQQMNDWMSKYKSWYQFVIETYRSRFEELMQTLDHVAFRSMDERLEFYLKRHLETVTSPIIELSHQQIADELNSSREVISRLLKKMEQLGKVRLHRNAIEVIKL